MYCCRVVEKSKGFYGKKEADGKEEAGANTEASNIYSALRHICRVALLLLRRTTSGAAGNGLGTTIN
jgi:hypothetical protein